MRKTLHSARTAVKRRKPTMTMYCTAYCCLLSLD